VSSDFQHLGPSLNKSPVLGAKVPAAFQDLGDGPRSYDHSVYTESESGWDG